MKVGVSKNGKTIELEDGVNVFPPSVASTALLCSVNDTDIKDKKVADIGCGTGYLGLGLLARGAACLYGTDIQDETIKAARKNAILNHFEKCSTFNIGDFCKASLNKIGSTCELDVIISNPPQTPKALLSGNAPALGTDGGKPGNDKIMHVLENSRRRLTPNGILYIPVFSYSNPDHTKKKASACFKKVEIIASHDIMFDIRRLALYKIFDHIYKQGHGYRIIHYGYPYWRIEVLRCRYPITKQTYTKPE
jgi:methylase of polypeptide subunit release factors